MLRNLFLQVVKKSKVLQVSNQTFCGAVFVFPAKLLQILSLIIWFCSSQKLQVGSLLQ